MPAQAVDDDWVLVDDARPEAVDAAHFELVDAPPHLTSPHISSPCQPSVAARKKRPGYGVSRARAADGGTAFVARLPAADSPDGCAIPLGTFETRPEAAAAVSSALESAPQWHERAEPAASPSPEHAAPAAGTVLEPSCIEGARCAPRARRGVRWWAEPKQAGRRRGPQSLGGVAGVARASAFAACIDAAWDELSGGCLGPRARLCSRKQFERALGDAIASHGCVAAAGLPAAQAAQVRAFCEVALAAMWETESKGAAASVWHAPAPVHSARDFVELVVGEHRMDGEPSGEQWGAAVRELVAPLGRPCDH